MVPALAAQPAKAASQRKGPTQFFARNPTRFLEKVQSPKFPVCPVPSPRVLLSGGGRPASLFLHNLSSLRLVHRTSLRRPALFAVGANRVGRRFLSSVQLPVLPPLVSRANRRSRVFVVGAKARGRRMWLTRRAPSKKRRPNKTTATKQIVTDNPRSQRQKNAF